MIEESITIEKEIFEKSPFFLQNSPKSDSVPSII